jgi:hypothetical protein
MKDATTWKAEPSFPKFQTKYFVSFYLCKMPWALTTRISIQHAFNGLYYLLLAALQ